MDICTLGKHGRHREKTQGEYNKTWNKKQATLKKSWRKKYRGNGGNVQYVDREIALNTDIINLTVGTKESKQIWTDTKYKRI